MKKYIAIFFIAAAFVSTSLVVNGIAPFGDSAMLGGDMGLQYMDYMQYMLNMMKLGDYNFNVVSQLSLGHDFIGLFMYYLSSPITLVVLFVSSFSDLHMIDIISVLTIIKIALSACTMLYYLRSHFKENREYAYFFAIAYALCGYNLTYSENLMWLDTVIYLPILIKLVDDFIAGKNQLYVPLIVALTMFSNFYTGYMAILFSGFYFFYQSLILKKKIAFPLLQYIGYVALGCFLVCVVLMPTVFSISGQDGDLSNVTSIAGFDKLKSIFHVLIGQSNAHTMNQYPLLYSGLSTIMLIASLMLNKKIENREKIITVFAIIILLSGLLVPFIDSAWHLFRYPFEYPFRYVFVLNFFCIFLAYRSLVAYEKTKSSYLLVAFLGLIVAAQFYQFKSYALQYAFVNGIVILAVVGLLLLQKKKFIVYLLVIEVVLNMVIVHHESFGRYLSKSAIVNYDQMIHENLIEVPELYRLDKTMVRPRYESIHLSNESLYFDYNGISSYSSIVNRDVMSAFYNLGYEFWEQANIYTNENAFVDSLLGIKYVMSNKASVYDAVEDSSILYENPYALPIAFVSESDLSFVMNEDIVQNQNKLSQALLGVDVLNEIEYEVVYYTNLHKTNERLYERNDYFADAFFGLMLENPQNTQIYMVLEDSSFGNVLEVHYAGRSDNYFAGENDKLILLGENFEENLQLDFKPLSPEIEMRDMKFYSLNEDTLAMIEENVRLDYRIQENQVYVDSSGNDYLYLSIPNNEHFKIMQNGIHITPDEWLESLIKIPLEEGENIISFSYSNKIVNYSLVVNLIAVGLYIGMIVRKRKKITRG